MPAMPRKLPYLNRQPGRHDNGRVYWYVRVGKGPRIPIQGDYGSPEFLAAYSAAVAGGKPPTPPVKASRGTLRWLVETWKRSSDWNSAEPATRRQRDHFLQQMIAVAGDSGVEDITEEVVAAGREHRQDTPAAANNYLKTARALFRWAKKSRLVAVDPARDVEFIKVKTEGFRPWKLEEVEDYRKKHPIGTTARLALELFLNTGFRRGDAARVGRQHVRDGVIEIRAGKNGVSLYIPILPALQQALDAMPRRDALTFLVTRRGGSYTKESLGNEFRTWCDAAKVEKSAHGLRKLAATVLADAGGSEQELQALFGWTTNTMSMLYTRERDRKRQALQAAFKLQEELESKGNKTPNPSKKTAQPHQ